MSAPISLRPARPDDEEFLYHVYASTREEELAVTGWDRAQKDAFLRMQFTAQFRHYRDMFPASGYEVILSGDTPAGRLFVHRGDDEIRVVDVGLLPEYRNQGIGGALMKAVMDEASRAGKPVRLHVESFNRALRFYQRLGFVTTDEAGIYLAMEWVCP